MTAFACVAPKGQDAAKLRISPAQLGSRPNGRYIKSEYLVTQLSINAIA